MKSRGFTGLGGEHAEAERLPPNSFSVTVNELWTEGFVVAFHGNWAENANAGRLAAADAMMASPKASRLLRERADELMAATLRQLALTVLLMAFFIGSLAVFFSVEGFTFGAALFGVIGLALAGIAGRIATHPSGI